MSDTPLSFKKIPPLAAAVALLLTASACSRSTPADNAAQTTLVVFAAGSLTDVFNDVEAAFEEANPGIDVKVSYGASSALREQILEGAPADVFASANLENMALVAEGGEVKGDPTPFARNQMQIGVPSGNPAGVTDLGDFARADLLIGLCAEQAPCGAFARRVLEAAGIEAIVDTDEPNVRFLLTKIEAGELDAGLVYRTDVSSTDQVDGVDIPTEWNVDAVYPIAVLTGAGNPEGAAAFIRFALSPTGASILSAHGFLMP